MNISRLVAAAREGAEEANHVDVHLTDWLDDEDSEGAPPELRRDAEHVRAKAEALGYALDALARAARQAASC